MAPRQVTVGVTCPPPFVHAVRKKEQDQESLREGRSSSSLWRPRFMIPLFDSGVYSGCAARKAPCQAPCQQGPVRGDPLTNVAQVTGRTALLRRGTRNVRSSARFEEPPRGHGAGGLRQRPGRGRARGDGAGPP